MNRYDNTFKKLRQNNRTAFMPFTVAGDPNMAVGADILKTFLKAGADILEIGYPFSDPVADGPVNQRAAQRAINAGITPARFFKMVGNLRKETDAPFGLLTYANIVNRAGYERFCELSAKAGIDSILVADMPFEESGEMLFHMKNCGLKSVFIVSELTPPARMKHICSVTTGFIYVVSRLGPTGVHSDFSTSAKTTIAKLRKITSLPLCVGFGISSTAHVAAVRNAGADGAIAGSLLVSIVEKFKNHPKAMLESLHSSVKSMVKACG
jgi:tryptophan synthase alpha chain